MFYKFQYYSVNLGVYFVSLCEIARDSYRSRKVAQRSSKLHKKYTRLIVSFTIIAFNTLISYNINLLSIRQRKTFKK